jgi:hypothetical protein
MRTTNLSGSCGTASQRLMVSNPKRLWLGIRNTHGSQNLYIGTQSPASATNCLNIIDPGGYFELTIQTPYPGPLYIAGSGAATTFVGQEVSND